MPKIVEVPLNFSNLAEIDNGRVDSLLRLHLQRIATDLIARPVEKAKRKLTLEFSIVPTADPDTGECDGCKVAIEARSKVPLYRTKTYEMRVSKNGLLFNRDFPDAVNQQSLLAGDEPQKGTTSP